MIILYIILTFLGELAQLARASALQAEGQGFEPPILHTDNERSLTGTREGKKDEGGAEESVPR